MQIGGQCLEDVRTVLADAMPRRSGGFAKISIAGQRREERLGLLGRGMIQIKGKTSLYLQITGGRKNIQPFPLIAVGEVGVPKGAEARQPFPQNRLVPSCGLMVRLLRFDGGNGKTVRILKQHVESLSNDNLFGRPSKRRDKEIAD